MFDFLNSMDSKSNEPIKGNKVSESSYNLPKPLKEMRKISLPETESLDTSKLFYKQALFLENYEDNSDIDDFYIPYRFLPDYVLLSDRELITYFAWRTQWRKGNHIVLNQVFLEIYVNELFNLIGCKDSLDAFNKLVELCNVVNSSDIRFINFSTDELLRDFVILYELDPKLLNVLTEEGFLLNNLAILDDMQNQTQDNLFKAVINLCPNIKKSYLYKRNPEDFKFVILNTLLQIKQHYGVKTKKRWIEVYFGHFYTLPFYPFNHLLLYKKTTSKDKDIDLEVSTFLHFCYKHSDDLWYVIIFELIHYYDGVFRNLITTIDSKLRDALNCKQPIKPKPQPKWVIAAIEESINRLQHHKKNKRDLKLNISKLSSIRYDASQTCDKLLTEEELNEEDSVCEASTNVRASNYNNHTLSSEEKRYLECLLNNSSTSWTSANGLLDSILCDSINEKLYDLFEDNVLEDGVLIEEYTEELRKELQK